MLHKTRLFLGRLLIREKALKWIFGIIGKAKWLTCMILILQVISSGIGIGMTWFFKQMIDGAVAGNRQVFQTYTWYLIGVIVSWAIVGASNRYLKEYGKGTVENKLKGRLFSNVLEKEYASVTYLHSGEWMSRMTTDTQLVAEGIVTIIPDVAGMLIKLIGAIVMMLILLPDISFLVVGCGIVACLLTFLLKKKIKELHKRQRESDGTVRVYMLDRLTNLLIVHSFAKEKSIKDESGLQMKEYLAIRMKKSNFSNLCNTGFSVLMNSAYIGGGIYCGYQILNHNMTYGTLFAVVQLVGQIQSPFANISGYLPKYYAMIASAERLMESEEWKTVYDETVLSDDEINEFYSNHFHSIRLKNASFSYKNQGIKVMENVDMEIAKGEYLAITGTSGCGKSTMLKLMMNLYPLDEGECVLVTNEGEAAMTAVYRSMFAYVPQGNQLMQGRIREIVAFSDEKKMEDTSGIIKALEIACAKEFVLNLKEGIDTMLGEGGRGLSEGQMQRIAIARAVYSGNPILLFDEATSSLDEMTEKKVLGNIRNMTNKTVVIVTHRMSVLEICDREVNMSPEGIRVSQLPKIGK